MNNYERMIALADEVFAYKTDAEQLIVDESVIQRLKAIHPACLSEYIDGDGPVAWILLFPTTEALENQFLAGKISEKQLFLNTPPKGIYTAIYLCSALVLPEYRRKGIAKKLTLDAIEKIRKDHPVTSLFVWPFTKEGQLTAEKLAQSTGLALKKRTTPPKDHQP